MTSQQILDAIEKAISNSKLIIVQQSEDYSLIIDNYSTFLEDYKTNTKEQNDTIREEVRKIRPLIGRRLFEQLSK